MSYGRSPNWHDIAQICLNGHMINDSVKKYPEYNKNYCPDCGEKGISNCQKCNASIQGALHASGVMDFSKKEVPKFCMECGKPFPWTEERIKAAIELINEDDELSKEDMSKFEDNIADIVSDGPRTQLAATRLNKIIKNATSTVGSGVRDILVDIASETAKKLLGL